MKYISKNIDGYWVNVVSDGAHYSTGAFRFFLHAWIVKLFA